MGYLLQFLGHKERIMTPENKAMIVVIVILGLLGAVAYIFDKFRDKK